MTCQYCKKEGEKLNTQFTVECRIRTYECKNCGKIIRIEKRGRDSFSNSKPVNTEVITPGA